MSSRQRRLAAILAADAVGYSRLMGEDEAATVTAIAAARELFADHAGRAGGRIVNAPGDSILAEFASVVDAVSAAVELQHELAERNAPLPAGRRLAFRIGINLGDVIVQDDAIYGDGVNVAARLESLAPPGGVCVARNVFDQVKSRLPLEFDYLGEHEVKNIAEPVRVYRVRGLGAETPAPAPTAPPPRPPAALPAKPTVAVLPFESLAADPGLGHFCDGLTEEIIAGLSRFSALTVIARNSTFRYKGTSVDIREVGRELGADYVMEGSVRRGRERMRITAQLLTAENGAHLWAESYERTEADADELEIQAEVAGQIAGTVADRNGVIFRTRVEELRRRGAEAADPAAAVLLAQGYLGPQMNAAMHASAREALERAVQIAPHYADAWAALAHIYRDEHAHCFNPRPEPLERAADAAQRAIDLDAAHQSAHAALYQVLFFRRQPEFMDVLERTLALNPNNPAALAAAGLFLSFSGAWERGLALAHRAIDRNPTRPGWFYVVPHWERYRAREYEAALAYAVKVDMPGSIHGHMPAAVNFGQLGRPTEAAAALAKLEVVYPNFARHARSEIAKWQWEEAMIEQQLEGLRKAGLAIPPD